MGMFWTSPKGGTGQDSDDCEHDTRPLTHTNADGTESTGAYCIRCGMEWPA